MSRLIAICFAVLAAIGLAQSPAHASDGGLVRIEPRPYYGAVVTIEHGVRVFRPLPSQHLMIINPNNAPVNLSFNQTVEHRSAAPMAIADNGIANNGSAPVYHSGYGANAYGTNGSHRRAKQRLYGAPAAAMHRPHTKPSHH